MIHSTRRSLSGQLAAKSQSCTAVVEGWSARRVRAVVWVALAVPFVIAAIALATRDYHPVLDLAMTEFRVRDVGTANTPLVGLPGRIGVFPDQGSHPGPLSFYLLAPTYRLLGSSAWALLVGMIVLNLIAIAVALWLAFRRGGRRLVVVAAALVAVLVRGYGLEVLTQPWNPYLPLLFWLVVLLAAWSVLDGDHAMIVVVVAMGSLCAQTHLPYLGLSLGMGVLCVASLATHWWRHPADRSRVATHAGRAAVVGVVLWIPVVIDQLWPSAGSSRGNLAMLSDYFRSPPEPPIGVVEGGRLLLRHLDAIRLVRGMFGGDGYVTRAAFDLGGTVMPGLLVLIVWAAAVVLAWRRGERQLTRLNVVIGWSMVLAMISMGRIFGKVWYYLTLWAWTTTALAMVSIVWTAWILIRDARGRVAVIALASVVGVGSYATLVVEAAGTSAPEAHLSDTLAVLVGPTVAALEAGLGAADGADGRYVVTWNDARYFGSQGYGLVSELERRGLNVGVPNTWRVPVTPHRVLDPASATADVRLVTGFYIDEIAAVPGAEQVIVFDPRDAGELAEYAQLEAEVTASLTNSGLDDLVPLLTSNLFGLQLDPRVSTEDQRRVNTMLELGTPTAVFILPPGSGE
jgi:hypothetical protein